MDEIENLETGQTLMVYGVDADEHIATGQWKRIRSDLPAQPSVRQRPGGVLGQSEIKRSLELVTEHTTSKGTRK
jgi:hypothetical protein